MSLSRKSLDQTTNNTGFKLLDICKNNNLFILNGRTGKDKHRGNFTFRQASVIDYTLASVDSLKLLKDFDIIDTDPIFSDGHSILQLTTACCGQPRRSPTTPEENRPGRAKWHETLAQSFCDNIDQSHVTSILRDLDSLTPNKQNINEMTERISHIFEAASPTCFPQQPHYHIKRIKTWFGPNCKTARRKYHLARKRFNKHRNDFNRSHMIECSRQYKKTMNKFIAKHKKSTQQKLRQLQSKCPKDYWRFINSIKHKTNANMPDLKDFYEHFKLLSQPTTEETETPMPDTLPPNESLNAEITSEEIQHCINNLKNGKAPGLDMILNEYIKSTSSIFLPIYEKLFNAILDTGHFPEQWSTGCIHPIYKNKGDKDNAKNYRPITILSCLGKLFTSVLNSRLNDYLEESMLLSENQAAFRKKYSTLDHIFSLYALNEIQKSKKLKLFCCVVDFSAAFDSVWRIGLWRKLLQSNVNGNVFNVIVNMYKDIKSCVSMNGDKSSYFGSFSGVRQGENLSPVLFSLYLNDLENFLSHNSNASIIVSCNDEDLTLFMKLIVLLYADDTVIMASSETDLQYSLNRFEEYCRTWKLNINTEKTKVVVFGARKTNSFHFKLGDQNIEITDRYKYLGIYFSQSRSFLNARKHIAEQAKKAMHFLFCRINNLNLPIDLQLKLFDHTVVPILTYSCELWGYENLDMIERIHTDFLRKITKTRKSTPLYMLYAELGRFPLDIIIKKRMIGFWNRILVDKQTKNSYLLYHTLKCMNDPSIKWISAVKQILRDVGRYDLWVNQRHINTLSLGFQIKHILHDQFLQKWRSDLNNSSKGKCYNYYKDTVCLENYFLVLPKYLYLNMVQFRTGNHKMPVETGRWLNIDYDARKCSVCDKDTLGDEFHYLLECSFFKPERELLIPPQYHKRPNMLKYRQLLSCSVETCLRNLAHFMGIIIKFFRSQSHH